MGKTWKEKETEREREREMKMQRSKKDFLTLKYENSNRFKFYSNFPDRKNFKEVGRFVGRGWPRTPILNPSANLLAS